LVQFKPEQGGVDRPDEGVFPSSNGIKRFKRIPSMGGRRLTCSFTETNRRLPFLDWQ
jgi:hypothetical protein